MHQLPEVFLKVEGRDLMAGGDVTPKVSYRSDTDLSRSLFLALAANSALLHRPGMARARARAYRGESGKGRGGDNITWSPERNKVPDPAYPSQSIAGNIIELSRREGEAKLRTSQGRKACRENGGRGGFFRTASWNM